MKQKRLGRNYLICMLIGLVVAVGVYAYRGGNMAVTFEEHSAVLCDACFIPAIMFLSMSALIFVTNDGMFDMIAYGTRRMLRLILSEKKQAEFPKSFYEYRKQKWEKEKSQFMHFILSGLTYLVLAFVFLFCSGTI